MHLPKSLIESLQGIKGFEQEAFERTHEEGSQVTSIRFNPSKVSNIDQLFPQDQEVKSQRVPWCRNGFYLSQRPSFTFDPLFHAGCYYVQEASSMFVEQCLLQQVDLSESLKVLDLCAAPGGKSTHLQSLISQNSLLVSNEVIRPRANILKENIIKWGCNNVVVTNNDPKDFNKLKGFFDVLVVDAPCSGSGLFRRDAEAVGEWSEANVELCSQRQQRILADILPSLKDNGILIYSTCSYSEAEDEEVVDWLCREFELECCRMRLQPEWDITEIETASNNFGYRFWPYLVKGEGFFISVFRKSGSERFKVQQNKIKTIAKGQVAVLEKWLSLSGNEFVQFGDVIYAWPSSLLEDMALLADQLKVIYSGTAVGAIMRDKLIPDHALAMNSRLIAEAVTPIEIDRDTAIRYLQKKDILLNDEQKGWQPVSFKNHFLGWVNVLANRVNNYYPKELRILREKPDRH